MTRTLSAACVAALVVGLAADTGYGQCAYERPNKAKKFQAELTQAMNPCGSGPGEVSPNATTEDGLDGCAPPTTWGGGFPEVDTWQWSPKTKGTLLMKAAKKDKSRLGLDGDTDTDGGTDDPEDIGDVEVRLKLSNVVDTFGLQLATSGGTLSILLRATFRDRLNGDLTMIDFPLVFPFSLVNGRGTLRTSANVRLDELDLAPLPRCASLEVVAAGVLDGNGAVFAVPGLFIGSL